MDARLKAPKDPRPLTREECIVETVLGIIGGATVIEDGIERQIDPHDIHGVLYHLREACLAISASASSTSPPKATPTTANCMAIKVLCARGTPRRCPPRVPSTSSVALSGG